MMDIRSMTVNDKVVALKLEVIKDVKLLTLLFNQSHKTSLWFYFNQLNLQK